jgi:hypothetical protein
MAIEAAQVALLGAAAGGAYLLAKSQREELGGAPVGTEVQAPTGPERTSSGVRTSFFYGSVEDVFGGANATSGTMYGGPAATVMSDAELRAYIENVKAEWNKLSEEARCAGMAALKKSLEGTPQAGALDGIDCRAASFEDVTSALVSEAAGEACARYPKTAALAPLCAAVGKVAGHYIGQGLEVAWNETKDAVKDAVNEAWDYATFW